MKRLAISINDNLQIKARLEEIPASWPLIYEQDYNRFITKQTIDNVRSITTTSVINMYHPDIYLKDNLTDLLFYAPTIDSYYNYIIYKIGKDSFIIDKQSLLLKGSGTILSSNIRKALNELFNIGLITTSNSSVYYTVLSELLMDYRTPGTVTYLNFKTIFERKAFALLQEEGHRFVPGQTVVPDRRVSDPISEETLEYYTFFVKNKRITDNEYATKNAIQEIMGYYAFSMNDKNSLLLAWILLQESNKYERTNAFNYSSDKVTQMLDTFDKIVVGGISLNDSDLKMLEDTGIEEEEVIKYTYHYHEKIRIGIKDSLDKNKLNEFLSIKIN